MNATDKAIIKKAGDVAAAKTGADPMIGDMYFAEQDAENARNKKTKEIRDQDAARKKAVAKTGKEDPADNLLGIRKERLRRYTEGKLDSLED